MSAFVIRREALFASLKKFVAVFTACAVLAGCATSGGGGVTAPVGPVGPKMPQQAESQSGARQSQAQPAVPLDVAIPTFDPGLRGADGTIDYERVQDEGIWPQLRRAEANRFAVKMKRALEETGAFGAVRVVTNTDATADLYVMGHIDESNAEDVQIQVSVVDIANRKLGSDSFSHRVNEGFFRDLTNAGQDPYDPAFREAAAYVADLVRRQDAEQLRELQQIAAMRFASTFAPEQFAGYLEERRGEIELVGLPAEDDPMMERIEALRVQEQLFIDRLQGQYDTFYDRMNGPYTEWQREALPIAVEARKARRNRNIAIGLSVLTAVVGGFASIQGNSAAGVLATGLATGYFAKRALDKSAEARAARDELDEIGRSLDIDMSPQVIELEGRTVKLEGTAEEQYRQWRAALEDVYELEKTPDKQL